METRVWLLCALFIAGGLLRQHVPTESERSLAMTGPEVCFSIASKSYPMKGGFVYIITNAHHTVLYVGVTSNLFNRTIQHRDKIFPKSFSARYNLSKLVYYEIFDSIVDAIAREKQLKGGSRKKKESLINKFNPEWKDLFEVLVNEGRDT
jgi:putative endonuclease